MATTNFSAGTVVTSDWLNDADYKVYGVKSYGAAGNGTTDDTAAIQAAIDAAAAYGGIVYFPSGTYRITSALTVSSNNLFFKGDGNVSKIQRSHASNNVFTVSAVQKINWEDLTIVQDSTITSTGGYGIEFTGAGTLYAWIKNVIFENLYHGVGCTNTNASSRVNNIFIDKAIFWQPLGVGIYAQNALEWFITDTIIDHGVTGTTADTAAIWLSTACEAFYLDQVSCLHGEYTIRIDQRTIDGGAGNTSPTNMLFNKVVADNGGLACWYLHDTRLCRFSQTWASTQQGTASGWIFEDNTRDTHITDSIVYGCNGHGILMRGFGHSVTDSLILANSLATNNTYDGINIQNNYTSIKISGNMIGTYPGVNAYQRYGINVGAACNALTLTDNDFYHFNNKNVSGAINGVGAVTDVYIKDNTTGDSRNVASAGTVTLPLNGDYFVITGTTGITSITNSWVGRRVTLVFNDILTVTDGSNLGLAGNFVTSANDVLELVSTGSAWLEVSRSAN